VQSATVSCSLLQHVAVCFIVLQCGTVCFSGLLVCMSGLFNSVPESTLSYGGWACKILKEQLSSRWSRIHTAEDIVLQMYKCVYSCMYICAYMYIYVVCIYIYVYVVHGQLCMLHRCIFTPTYTSANTLAADCAHMCICIYVCVCMHMHMDAYVRL